MGNSTNAETRVCCPLRIAASVGVLDTTRCWLPCTTTDRMLSLRHPTCTSMACKVSQELLILMMIAASASGTTAPVCEFRNYAPEPVPSVLKVRTPTQFIPHNLDFAGHTPHHGRHRGHAAKCPHRFLPAVLGRRLRPPGRRPRTSCRAPVPTSRRRTAN